MTVCSDTTPAYPGHVPAWILDHFAELPDPRREQGRIHQLDEIVFIAICAVLCGADSWEDIAAYGRSKLDWLQTFLTLPGGIPSHDTFRRVFCRLDPLAFQKCFYGWMTALMTRRGLTPISPEPPALRPVAIDGKTQHGSARRTVGQSASHVVSAWAVENRLTLGQVATDAKSNEITAIPELLQLLDLEGTVVTIDAMGCQKEIAAEIVGEGGQYVLAVKENQPHLYEDIQRAFDEALDQGEPGVDFSECETEETRSDRQETRTCCVITNPSGIRDARLWVGLAAICVVSSASIIGLSRTFDTAGEFSSASAEPEVGQDRGLSEGITRNSGGWVEFASSIEKCGRADNRPGFCIGMCHPTVPSYSADDQVFEADLGPCGDHRVSVRHREPSQELLDTRERPPFLLVGVRLEEAPLIPTQR
jgi:predicted transposase YbfD/YdcC